jgi:hypothetical protein
MPAFRIHLRPWVIITGLCLLYCLFIVMRNGDPRALVTLGTQFSDGISAEAGGTEGYDGQFVYYIARDPSTAASLGRESLIPWAFLLINLFSLAAGTALLEHLLVQKKVSRWYALGYGLTLGIFGSVRLSLPEPLAYALVLGGIVLAERQHWGWSGLVFGLAALAKETTLILAAGYTLYLLFRGITRPALMFGIIALAPFIVWQVVLYQQFRTFGVGSGGALATSFEIIPFAGVARILTDSPPETRAGLLFIFSAILLPFVLIPTFWGLWRCWQDIRSGRWSVYTALLFTTAAIMLFVPFSTYREAIGILRFIVGMQIAVILYAAAYQNRRALQNSTIWVLTTLFIFSLL